MFLGRFFHKINAKNQTSVPSSLRGQIPEGQTLHFVRSGPDCLFLYTEHGVAKLTDRVREKTGVFDGEFRRMFTSDIMPVDMDGQGRIVVPKDIREQYGLRSDVVFVGAGSRIELWARLRWEKFDSKHRPGYRKKLQRIIDDVFDV